jgi:uncharacterized protein YcbX
VLPGEIGGNVGDHTSRPTAQGSEHETASTTLHVAELWRYPVKSLLGERRSTLSVVAGGIAGDRMLGIQDRNDGHNLTELGPRRRCVRCTMVNRAQPGLDRDVTIYKTLHRSHRGDAGMWTEVVRPGTVSSNDAVMVT